MIHPHLNEHVINTCSWDSTPICIHVVQNTKKRPRPMTHRCPPD